jgi:hypothetical protein
MQLSQSFLIFQIGAHIFVQGRLWTAILLPMPPPQMVLKRYSIMPGLFVEITQGLVNFLPELALKYNLTYLHNACIVVPPFLATKVFIIKKK